MRSTNYYQISILNESIYISQGQGAQFTGMGLDLVRAILHWRKNILKKQIRSLGFSITDIMFEGTSEQLKANESYTTCYFSYTL